MNQPKSEKHEDLKAYLLSEIEGAENVEILGADPWSYLFKVSLRDREELKGILYKAGIAPGFDEWSWELET